MYVREFVYRHPYREVFEQNLRRRENMISEGVSFQNKKARYSL